MNLADRVSRLGTETAFSVSAEAQTFAAQGRKVYPFHLGDLNIPTPQNIVDATLRAIRDGRTGYCPNAGVPRLRELLAADINRSHGTHFTADNVVIEPGGKPVINKFFLALMNPGDEVLYPNPGYPIYESQIEFHGGHAVPYGYRESSEGFEVMMDQLETAVTKKTRLLVLNSPQNPMGTEFSTKELERIAALVLKHNLFVLSDEAYYDIRYEGKTLSLASLPGMEERCVILYTFSKKFAMTGWRLGAAVGPRPIADVFAKLNVNDESCSNHFVQYGAIEALTGDQSGPKEIIRILKERRDAAVAALNSIKGVQCYNSHSTFYLFPNVTQAMSAGRRMGATGYDQFRRRMLQETGVSFCTRLHFGRPLPGEKEKYIRFAYSGIDADEIREGLALLKKAMEKQRV